MLLKMRRNGSLDVRALSDTVEDQAASIIDPLVKVIDLALDARLSALKVTNGNQLFMGEVIPASLFEK